MTTNTAEANFYSKADITIDELEKALAAYTPQAEYPHDEFVKICVEEACMSIREGNNGVGSCLVRDGKVIVRGHNQGHHPYFRSDRHGEMTVMTAFEDQYKNAPDMHTYTLFTSLEPCPMCTVRLITAGVGQVYWGALDPESGMMATMERMTPVWAEMAKRQEFGPAKCSPELSRMSKQVWLISANTVQDRVRKRRRLHEASFAS